MEISNLDVALLAEHVRKFAEAEPHTHGRVVQCQYFHDSGEASCIVGHGMALQGITRADLTGSDGDRNGTYIVSMLNDVLNDDNRVAAAWIGRVQSRQDQGYNWAEAVAHADSTISTPVIQT